MLASLTIILTLGTLAQWLAWRTEQLSIAYLLLFGFAIGPFTQILNPDQSLGPLLIPLVNAAVCVILFEGGLHLRFKHLRELGGVVRNLVTIGALVTWLLAALTAHFLIGLSAGTALLLGPFSA